MGKMSFEEQYQSLQHRVNVALKEQLEQFASVPETIYKSINYSLFAGGKRLRPIMLLSAHSMLDGNLEESMPLACGIEMIHTYSLIHDDLPAMDDDDFRRGIPTNHKVFGEGIAVLAGDGLLNLAYEIMLKNALKYPEKIGSHIKAIYTIAEAAGIGGMIGGQVVDLEWEGKNADLNTLKYIHEHKTGALFVASLMAGILLEDPPRSIQESVYRYGKYLGLAFQIIDDILDVVGDSEKLGKQTGRDMDRNKSTYVQLYGVDKSKKIAEELIEKAVESLSEFGQQANFLKELAYYIQNRQN